LPPLLTSDAKASAAIQLRYADTLYAFVSPMPPLAVFELPPCHDAAADNAGFRRIASRRFPLISPLRHIAAATLLLSSPLSSRRQPRYAATPRRTPMSAFYFQLRAAGFAAAARFSPPSAPASPPPRFLLSLLFIADIAYRH